MNRRQWTGLISPVVGLAMLSGCSSSPDSEPISSAEVEVESAPAGFATLDEAFDAFGCEGRVMSEDPPVVASGTCDAVEDGALAFFWEFETPAEATRWLKAGELEIGSTDAVYVSGSVVMLATDAAIAQQFAEVGSPYP